MALDSGKTLGHYTILDSLGVGGMGEVYRARDGRLSREVAIKVLPEEFVEDEERLRRFEREAKVLASLSHPNIDAIHGLEKEGSLTFLVLELVPGQTLYVLECEPAAYAALATNEAEKAAEINVLEVRAAGAMGRVYLGGEERDIDVGWRAAVAALEGLDGRE